MGTTASGSIVVSYIVSNCHDQVLVLENLDTDNRTNRGDFKATMATDSKLTSTNFRSTAAHAAILLVTSNACCSIAMTALVAIDPAG